ncbi:hypothetical protein K3N28_05880 [Glycomyces sp. TRM65418]|uniref:hypothetical protein n=1 Tax=Glycomyces sp. TRM65418 TaxID=2867006 RepID=UPI001CE6A9F7|nr:hypothetical protein [Glycomyces sp. TRM65418]MCC3762598.1 hypothetical protein [Glycomyces sp. TRM65418]QZD56636.1 hypothetical protein K3N28_05840 [Glycomyces sp. TRM65418]
MVRTLTADAPPVEQVHGVRLPGGGVVRLAFRTRPGIDLVTVHTAYRDDRLVCEVRRFDAPRPVVWFANGFGSLLSRRCNTLRRCARRLHFLTADPDALSLVPRLPGPESEWFNVRGTQVAFTPNAAARWVTLYTIVAGEPVFVAQVARIEDTGRAVLRLAEAWVERVDAATGDLMVAAGVHVWDVAVAARAEEVRTW